MKNTLLRRFIFLALLLLIMFLVSGCWSRREIDELGFIGSVAIDQADNPKLLEVTAQFILPKALASGGQTDTVGVVGGRKVWLISAQGATVFEALYKINALSANYLFFGHQSSVIIGEEVARKGVMKILDSFDRMPQLRRNIRVMIAPGKAKNILQASPKLLEIPSLTIEKLFSQQGITSISYPSTLNSLLIMLSSRSTAPVAARVTIQPTKEVLPKVLGNNLGEVIRNEIKLEGAALLRNDKLAGWLTGRETRGVLWVQNKVKRGTLTFPNRRGNHNFVTFEVLASKTKIHTFIKDGKLLVNIKINFDSNLVDQTSDADILSRNLYNEPENVSEFQAGMSSHIKQEIFAAVKKSQNYQADVFGIGERFYIEYPQEFKQIQKDWPEFFAKAKFNVVVDGKIRRVGLINRSINAQKK